MAESDTCILCAYSVVYRMVLYTVIIKMYIIYLTAAGTLYMYDIVDNLLLLYTHCQEKFLPIAIGEILLRKLFVLCLM